MKFLTVLPVPQSWCGDEWDLAESPRFHPLVGAGIGILLAVAWWLVGNLFYSDLMGAVAIVAMSLFISGGLHIDGLADTADGFFSSRPRERILEIMKDSHIGTMGVVAVVMVLMFKVAAWRHILGYNKDVFYCIAFVALAGRCSFAPAMALLPCARESGLGRLFWLRSTPLAWGALGIVALAGFLLQGFWGLAIALAVAAVILLFNRHCQAKIGGGTGDTLGAQLELVECVVLLMWTMN